MKSLTLDTHGYLRASVRDCCKILPYFLHPRLHDQIVPQVDNLMRKMVLTQECFILLDLISAYSALMSTPIVHCQREDKTARERIGHTPIYARLRK